MAPVRPLIDWHTHCFLPEHISAEEIATMQAHGVKGGMPSPEEHQKAVVDTAAKFVVIAMPNRHASPAQNTFVAEYTGRFPGRAAGFACVDPNDQGADVELERCVTKLGLKGLKLSPVYQGFDPWAPAAWRLYDIADAHHIPVMFHMGGAFDPLASLEYGSPFARSRRARLSRPANHCRPPRAADDAGDGDAPPEEPQRLRRPLGALHRKWQLYNGLRSPSNTK